MNGLASVGHLVRLGSVPDRFDGIGKKSMDSQRGEDIVGTYGRWK